MTSQLRSNGERWPSGLRRTLGKRVYVNSVPWVRIPLSPPTLRGTTMRYQAAACALAGVIATASLAADYQMTVSRDRLVNAQNEPQNWLLMNGDYAATRYSKLTQINRDNVKNLRLVWAIA